MIAWTTSFWVDFVAFVERDVAAEPQHGDPVGDLEDVVQVVRDQDDGEPLLGQPLDELEHLLRLRDAERGGRLVEDHEPRVPHHRAGDGDGLSLAARKGRDRLPDRADRRHGEALHRLRGLGLHHRLLEPVQPVAGLAAEVHVLDDVEVVAEREVLVDDLDPELGGVLRAVDVHRLAVDDDLAAVRRVRAGDALDQGRLAGAVVADERHHLTGTDLEVDLAERLDRAEALRDPVELQERGRRVPRRSWSWVKKVGARPPGGPHPGHFLGAVLLVLADADLRLLQVAVEELLVVRLRDRDRRDDEGGDRPAPVLHRARRPRRLVVHQRDGR